MQDSDLIKLLRRVISLIRPNLRNYYRVVRKAQVVKTYASDGQYRADVQPLLNDNNKDDNEPVIPKVEIPILWAGPDRGVVCPPLVGVYCDLEYYDGDPDFPRISNFRWHKSNAPVCEVGAFIIQHSPGTHIKIDESKNIIAITPGNIQRLAGSNWTVEASGNGTVKAPSITLDGDVTITKTLTVSEDITGNANITAGVNVHAAGNLSCNGSNPNHHGHP